MPYTIAEGAEEHRSRVKGILSGLDLLPPQVSELIVTAWVSSWLSSDFADLMSVPSLPAVPTYRLIDHTNEVLRIGLDLAVRYEAEWSRSIDRVELISILLLHDIDKPLLYRLQDGAFSYTRLYTELPHGVIGAMLLKELGFSHAVTSVVATHAVNAPFHSLDAMAFILHYADMFATDRVHLDHGISPFYQRMHLR